MSGALGLKAKKLKGIEKDTARRVAINCILLRANEAKSKPVRMNFLSIALYWAEEWEMEWYYEQQKKLILEDKDDEE